MKVLVVGAGMYVTGRQGSGVGTVMAAIAQAARDLPIQDVLIVGRSERGAADVTEAADRIGRQLGSGPAFRHARVDGERTLGEQLDLADVACALVVVPDQLHFQVASELLERNVPTLVVKPLTPTVAEARRLIAIQERRGTYAAVEFHKRWDESNLLARRYLTEGRLGRLVHVNVQYSQRIRIPLETFRGWADKTNIFQYLGVHYADLIWFLTGYQPVRAMAVGTEGVLRAAGVPTYDSVHAHVLWERDGHRFVTPLSIGWVDPNGTPALSDQHMWLVGSAGRLELDQRDRGMSFTGDQGGLQHVNPYFADYLPDQAGHLHFQGYGHRSIQTFLTDVRDLAEGRRTLADLEAMRPTLRQSLVSTAVVEAVNHSLANGFEWRDVDATI